MSAQMTLRTQLQNCKVFCLLVTKAQTFNVTTEMDQDGH